MKLPTLIIAAAAAFALFGFGCSERSGGSTSQVSGEPLAALTNNVQDLGEMELTNGVARTVRLEDGSTCLVTPTALPDGTLQIDLALEADGGSAAKARATTHPGQGFAISVGDSMIALTPTLREE